MTIVPEPRDALAAEIDLLARIWYDGWQDAHAAILPEELARDRTLESFKERLRTSLATVRVTGSPGSPTGFCMTKGDELYQLYVSADARGTGTARALIADAERRMGLRRRRESGCDHPDVQRGAAGQREPGAAAISQRTRLRKLGQPEQLAIEGAGPLLAARWRCDLNMIERERYAGHPVEPDGRGALARSARTVR